MRMLVTPLQQCAASSLHVNCFNCDVAYLASGTCMPGLYSYQYTLTNAEGHSAVPVNVSVQIYEQVGAYCDYSGCLRLLTLCLKVLEWPIGCLRQPVVCLTSSFANVDGQLQVLL